MAHLTADIARTEPTLTAPARAVAMATQADAERAIENGESRYLGIDWVTAGDVRANRIIPLPDPVRRGLVYTTDRVIATAGKAAAAAATLTPPEHLERVRANPTPEQYKPGLSMPTRFTELRDRSGRNPTPEGPPR
jgi:hypothetical protein